MIEIDKEKHPIPNMVIKENRRYPFAIMEVGDSFTIKLESNVECRKISTTLGGYCSAISKKTNKKFTQKKVDDYTIRVWRIK